MDTENSQHTLGSSHFGHTEAKVRSDIFEMERGGIPVLCLHARALYFKHKRSMGEILADCSVSRAVIIGIVL